MARKKSKNPDKKSKKNDEYRESNEYHDGLELEGADAFEAMQDENIKLKMDKVQGRNKFRDTSGGYQELFALSGDSDSDDEDLPEGVEYDDDEDGDEQAVNKFHKTLIFNVLNCEFINLQLKILRNYC